MNAEKDAYIKKILTQQPGMYEFYEGSNKPYLGTERTIHQRHLQLLKLCSDLLSHKFSPPFFKKIKNKRLCADASAVGMQMLNCLDMVNKEELGKASWGTSRTTFSPDIQIVIDIMRAALSKDGNVVPNIGHVSPLPVLPDEYRMQMEQEVEETVDYMNRLAYTLRKALLTPEMRARVKSFRRNATERYKQAMFVAHQAWNIHRKILLIRLDWSFKKRYPATRTSQISAMEFEAQLKEVNRYRKIMLKTLRKEFGKKLAFFVWKIECGEIKGLHIHWLIGLNGSKHQDRINDPRRIADMWDSEIGRSDAYTFNVNALFGSDKAGLKVIGYCDPELGEILGRYCDYLTKVDYCMKLRLPSNMRSFGCSKRRKSRLKKRGPLRKYSASPIEATSVRGPQSLSFRTGWRYA